MASQEFRRSLMSEHNALRTELNELRARRRAIDVAIEEKERYLQGMNPLLEMEGLPTYTASTEKKTGFAAPGNRGANMPPRREAFRNMTLMEALGVLLAGGTPMHATKLVESIYETSEKSAARRAKHSLVGTLAAGVRDGKWKRVRPNTFQIVDIEPVAPANEIRELVGAGT